MRLLFLTLGYHPDRVGGAYRYVREVAVRLASRGHQVTVIYPGPTCSADEHEMRDGVELRRFPDAKCSFYQNWRTENASARAQYQGWRSASNEPGIVVLCHAFLAPSVKEASERKLFFFTGPWAQEYQFSRKSVNAGFARRMLDPLIATAMNHTERSALRQSSRIVTISRYYQDHLPRWHKGSLPPVKMIGGGVDLETFHPPAHRAALRDQYRLKKKEFLFLCVRRLDPRMGLRDLLEAFSKASHEYPNALLWIAGDGSQRAELESQIQALGLGDRARLLGFVPEAELPKLYGAADCTIMPSLDLEGFGLATAESLACGTPVIGSRAGATPELLAALKPELIFNRGSVEALTEKLNSILINREWLPTREHCRTYAEQRFSWQQPVDALEQIAANLSS